MATERAVGSDEGLAGTVKRLSKRLSQKIWLGGGPEEEGKRNSSSQEIRVAVEAIQEEEEGVEGDLGSGKVVTSDVDDILKRCFQPLNKKGMSVPLSNLFAGLGMSLAALVKDKTDLQTAVRSFVFASGRQDLYLTADSAGQLVLQDKEKTDVKGEKQPGDIALHAVFEAQRTEFNGKVPRANELSFDFAFGGMPTIRFIMDVASSIVHQASKSSHRLQGPHVLNAFKKVFPATRRQFMDKVLDVEETFLHNNYITCSSSADGGGPDGLVSCLTASINLKKLSQAYPAVGQLLERVKSLDLCLSDGSALKSMDNVEAMDSPLVRELGDNAPIVLRLAIEQRGGDCKLRLVYCIRIDSSQLLYMDRNFEMPALGQDGQVQPASFDVDTSSLWLATINMSVLIQELGCASYQLAPLYFLACYNKPETPNSPEEIALSMLQIGPQSLFARSLVRPLLNLDTFKRLLLSTLQINIAIEPRDSSRKTGDCKVRFTGSLLKPRSLFMNCINFFLKRQISGMELLDMLRDLFSGLGEDMSGFAKTR